MAKIEKDTIIGDVLDIAPETAPLFFAIGSRKTSPISIRSRPRPAARTKPVAAISSALPVSCLPRAREM